MPFLFHSIKIESNCKTVVWKPEYTAVTVLELTSTKEKEFTVPMRLKPAMVKILRIHNSSTPIKPQDVEVMDACAVLEHLKAKDGNIVHDIIAAAEVQQGGSRKVLQCSRQPVR